MPVSASGLSTLIDGCDLIISDVWGVLHNGMRSYPAACTALSEARRAGKPVILVSNAPRQGQVVLGQLDRLGVPRSAYDGIVTSGDVARAEMQRRSGQSLYFIGPARDLVVFDGLDNRRVGLDEADFVMCSGLVDDQSETPQDYQNQLDRMKKRDLFFLCGNPDKVVEVGHRLLYCAGAIADLYQDMGGKVLYAGKPFPPAYEMALDKAAQITGMRAKRVLAIGDAMRTDIAGAVRMGFTSLFLAEGIHSGELLNKGALDHDALAKLVAESGTKPDYVMRLLGW